MDLSHTHGRGATEHRLNTVRNPPKTEWSTHLARQMQPKMGEAPLYKLTGNRRPLPEGDLVPNHFTDPYAGELAQLNGGTHDISYRPEAK